ncbi:MAG: bifunctional phosphoribosyl-AMP cyclohydrolase/phosphoribosyl-ATP diphosphatase HisIE [Bacteroidetes bacterium]|nr:bifunctional phosphoribosyl-AMP cyclohydrolase/phosphoribosyl-ATP diphosphatase HisIE [Bacteroidota bacterium]
MLDINTLDFEKSNGLLPAVVQDSTTLQVLMLGYMNREALQRTKETGRVWFFSRSKNRLWEKGETSGNYLNVKEISVDCDQDTLLLQVVPEGPVCHRGTTSCFDEEIRAAGPDFLYQLEAIIRQRAGEDSSVSYTRKLLDRGLDRMAQKVGEEAVEVVISAKNDDLQLLKGEMADLLYHLMVLMYAKGIRLSEVSEVLRQRHKARTSAQ